MFAFNPLPRALRIHFENSSYAVCWLLLGFADADGVALGFVAAAPTPPLTDRDAVAGLGTAGVLTLPPAPTVVQAALLVGCVTGAEGLLARSAYRFPPGPAAAVFTVAAIAAAAALFFRASSSFCI